MKLQIKYLFTLLIIICTGCSDAIDLYPKDKISGEILFSDPEGVKLYMANLYHQLPIEDFSYSPHSGFYKLGEAGNGGFVAAMYTEEACHSEWGEFLNNNNNKWWEEGYKLNRDVNLLIEAIPGLDIEESEKKRMTGESAFIRAYLYFALAKRYGGVCLIKEVQEYKGDVESLKVPRSTEKETWDFVLEECDRAIENLPESWSGGERRATKWAAYALKSKASLFAASVAKHSQKAPLSGEAANQKLIGMDASEADRYYRACIEASEAIMNSGIYFLYKSSPSSVEEAIENYREMFEDPNIAPEEAIFIKGYVRAGELTGHNYDIWYSSNQTANGWPHPGRMNPTLDFVDSYESYDHPGESAPVVTTLNRDVFDVNGFDPSVEYLRFDSPDEIFKNRDARFFATLITPNSIWKETKIIIQGGLVKPDGEALIETKAAYEHNGTVYHTYGAEETYQYSGFDTYGGNMTRTGFLLKKFLNLKIDISPTWHQSTSDFMDMRYAEVLLNYAEAVVESGYQENGATEKAKKAINDIRKRAGHTVDIPLTLENVLRERKVELAFENKLYWDMVRRREFHQIFNMKRRQALVPVLDLRGDKPQYIFIRKVISRDVPSTFDPKQYYRFIPDISTTGVVQNPQY